MIPLSLAMAYRSRLALVILADVPLMKQTLSIRAKMVAAARLFVLWRKSSTMGIPVLDARIVAGSVRQKRMTRMKRKPLNRVSNGHGVAEIGQLT